MTDHQQPGAESPVSFHFSDGFMPWLASLGASIAFTTYQSRKIFLIGTNAQGAPSVFERTLERVMGMAAHGQDLYLSTKFQIWRFRNSLAGGASFRGHDALYTPRQSWVTGDLDIHDMTITGAGELVFVNTLFNCLATVDENHSFRPIWTPPWISTLTAEDRCHLNGLALRDGKPRYVTAVSQSDVKEGWRQSRDGKGLVFDIEEQRVVGGGFTMPHSPRWHEGSVYLHDSGTGWFGRLDINTGEFHRLTFCPGYARGLAFHRGMALIGLSNLRQQSNLSDMPLEANLKERGLKTQCGLVVVDLASGEIRHNMRIDGLIQELYDVAFLEGVKRPAAIGFKTDEVHRFISVAAQKG